MSRPRTDSAEWALSYVLSRWFGASSRCVEVTDTVLADLRAEGYHLVRVAHDDEALEAALTTIGVSPEIRAVVIAAQKGEAA